MAEIKVGDRVYALQPFNGFKADMAGELVAQVAKAWPEIVNELADFRREFAERNAVRITREMARLPRFESLGFAEADFDAAGGVIELPQAPDTEIIVAKVFPRAYHVAREQVLKLLALVVIPNHELEAADYEGTVDEAISELARQLMHKCEFGDLMQLVADTAELVREEILGNLDRLRQAFSQLQAQATTEKPDSSGSSTDSPPPTTGAGETSSTESRSESSSLTAVS